MQLASINTQQSYSTRTNLQIVKASNYMGQQELHNFRQQAENFRPTSDFCLNLQLKYEAEGLLKFFTGFQELLASLHQHPYIGIEGLPLDSGILAPPKTGQRPGEKETWISELVMMCIAMIANIAPFAYKEEKQGKLIHEIAPIPGREHSASNAGRALFGFHTDGAILRPEYSPDYLLIMGLVNEMEVPIYISTLNQILTLLPSNALKVLGEARFRVDSPEVMQVWGGKIIRSEPRPLITQEQNNTASIAANLNSAIALDPVAAMALSTLKQIVAKVAQSVHLSPGTLIIFDNKRCLHGRSEIVGERWLQRLYCRRSLESLRQATNSATGDITFSISHLVLE